MRHYLRIKGQRKGFTEIYGRISMNYSIDITDIVSAARPEWSYEQANQFCLRTAEQLHKICNRADQQITDDVLVLVEETEEDAE